MPFHIPVQNGDNADYSLFNAILGGALPVYNNSGVSLPVGTYVKLDPTYTSGLGVTIASTLFDQRALGPVVGATIGIGGSGYIYAPGFAIAQAFVTGAIAFGHSLYTYSASGYLQDSGGGGWGPGIAGWALGAQASGTALMNILLHPYPSVYVGAQVITNPYYATNINSGAQTFISNIVNATPGQLLLFFAQCGGTVTANSWNAQTPTQLQAGAVNQAYVGYLLGAGAATSNWTATNANGYGIAVCLALNGINQGGGAATFGTLAHNSGTGTALSVTAACNPGDMVVCCFSQANQTSNPTPYTLPSYTEIINQNFAKGAVEVQWTRALGASVTFTLTANSPLGWSGDAIALHSV